MKSYRQGDVAFFKIEKIPEGFEKKGTVLEIRGEREGHIHLIENNVIVFERNGSFFDPRLKLPVAIIEVSEETTVTHPDHPDLILPAGIYEVRQAREFTGNRNRRVD